MQTAAPPRLPRDPYPVSPRHAEVVDGACFTFRWEPVPTATAYCLQVASDPEFRTIRFQQKLPGDTHTFRACYAQPGDDRTYFWRVLAGNQHGWSDGDRIESVTMGTEEYAGACADPDTCEPLGPVASLFKATTMQAYGEVAPGQHPEIDAAIGQRSKGFEGAEIFSINMMFFIAGGVLLAGTLLMAFTLLGC